jgi:ABC-type polar amino acid transport system ATPase subunit
MKVGIEVNGLAASYGDGEKRTRVIEEVSFKVRLGQIAMVVGPSGAGKSTLLNAVACMHPLDSGSVLLAADHPKGGIQHTAGQPLGPHQRRRVGIAYQKPNLWSHLNVRQNLIHPQRWLLRRDRRTANARADELLDAMGLKELGSSTVTELSGGQAQRVGILRSLALDPDVLLLDEVTASQDPRNAQVIFDLLTEYTQSTQCTVLTISHDMGFVERIADQVLFLADGQLRDGGSPERVFGEQADEQIKAFIDGEFAA